jgi:DNA polymerase-1
VAHLAQDEAMMSVFQNHEDIHTGTAMRVFGVEAKDVTPDMRRDAKTINFGILYGLSSFGLSSRIGEMTNADAKQFIEKYFAAYPKVYQYLERVKAEVHEHGFVTNEIGRIRKFPEIASSQYFIRAAAERAAINFPIQSLEADIVKLAMLRVAKAITGHESDIRMLLQVHDELVFEVKAGQKDKWMKTIFPLMDEAYKLTVPVEVEAKAGPSWGEMEKLKLG